MRQKSRQIRLRTVLFSIAAAGSIAASAVFMAPGSPVAADNNSKPTVVELFTSQSCYSCPPAEAYLGELAKRADVIALEFHVDYWDELVWGSAGKWKDRFSKPQYTERQRTYAARLPGGRSYTPQMVIDGQAFEVGSRKRAVGAALHKAAQRQEGRLDVSVRPGTDGALAVEVKGAATEPATIWLVRYIKEATTKVLRGENHGKTLVNHHVVTDVDRVGVWEGAPVTLDVSVGANDAADGCAILIQSEDQGPILGAASCPDPTS